MTNSTVTRLPSKGVRPTAPLERLPDQLEHMFELAQNACAIAEAAAFIYANNDAGDKGVPDPKRQFDAIAALTCSLVESIQAAKVELERAAA
jgi:hypothetical protein